LFETIDAFLIFAAPQTSMKQPLISLLITNPADRKLIADFLEDAGYRVFISSLPRERVEYQKGTSLIVADEKAARWYGQKLIALKWQSGINFLPLLILLPQRADSNAWLSAGFDDVLRVPLTKAELKARVEVFFRLLEASSENYSELFENALIGMYRVSADGKLLLANRAMINLLGYDSFEKLAADYKTRDGFRLQPTRAEFLRQIEKDGVVKGIESHFLKSDGTELIVLENARASLRGEQNEILFVDGSIQDITERKRAELNAAFLAEVGSDLVRVSDPADIVRIVGERLNAFLGVSMCAFAEISETADSATINYEWHENDVPSLLGVYRLPEFVTPEFLQTAMSGQTIVIRDVSADSRIADPEQFARLKIGAHVNVPLIRNGEWRFSLCVYRKEAYDWRDDEIKLIEELSSRVWARLERAFAEREREAVLKREQMARLQAEEASRLKDEFLATVSHELRTPLNAILGWSQILISGNFDPEKASHALKTIHRNAKTQAQLIEDILDVSRIITGKMRINPEPVFLAPVIQNVVESLRPSIEAKNISLHLGLDFESRKVNADSERLQQVVWNLVSNAIKFTPENGQITVKLESGESETKIVVSDTGKGISPEFLPFVFERFRQADGSTTRKHGGLGLGLAIVRSIVELHGGNVEVESEGEGKGATFTVRLPLSKTLSVNLENTNGYLLAADAAFAANDEAAKYRSAIKGMRVLLIDDEADTLELLTTILAQNGVEVRAQTSVREALETLKTWKPDAIISDLAIPEEDGYSFVKKLRALPPEEGGTIPVIALTAYVGIKEKTRVLAGGFQIYLPKPVEQSELLATLASLRFPSREQSG
jgi:PAS domain S-box-containing protein